MTPRKQISGRWRDERGLSLVELLMSSLVLVIVLGVGLAFVPLAVRNEPRISDRAAQIQQGRVLMERLSRELRQGYVVQSATPSQLVFVTYARRTACGSFGEPASTDPAIRCRVTYSCSGGTCTRTEADTDGSPSGSPALLVEGLSGSDVFSYLPSATDVQFVSIKLVFPASATDDAVTLQDGAGLRNVD
jgi:Tfp pilus assembly protein PilW